MIIEGKKYTPEYDPKDPHVIDNLQLAFCDELALDFAPIIYDPRDYGSNPYPPDILAYRLVIDPKKCTLCIIYEIYWRRQDCSWKELNKDHDHDYEQIQIHFNLQTGYTEKVIISSTGPIENGGHGIEIYIDTPKATVETVCYTTSNKQKFPWGGNLGQNNATQTRKIPLTNLKKINKRPQIVVLNCYHAFAGLKRALLPEEQKLLSPKLERLDRKLLEKWFYLHRQNPFAHDISKPFENPHIMYFPPPQDWISRLAYGYLWFISVIKRLIRI